MNFQLPQSHWRLLPKLGERGAVRAITIQIG
jgi:hypothetical protein